jgi:putative ABC transport system permease protein
MNDDLERWRRRVRTAIPAADPDLVEEVAQFVADRWTRAIESGIEPGAAECQAEADLRMWQGRTAPRRERPWYREIAWTGAGADVRFAARSLRVRPIFAVGAILLSAVAVTAVVSAFSIVYGILWRPLPYPDGERLAVIWQLRGGEETQISYPDFVDVSNNDVFEARAAISGGRGSLRIGDAIERVNALSIEAAGLAMLGATPHLGRMLNAGDADRPVVMVSHRLWTTHLNADSNIIGRLIWMSGTNYTVVGVLPPRFDFELPVPPSFRLEKNDVWMVLDTVFFGRTRRDFSGYEGLVRLAPGRTIAEAQAVADATALRLAREHAATNTGRTFRVAPLGDEVVGPVRQPMLFVGLAALVTLAVALANLGILGLARGSERQAEMSIREALGAGAFRLRRQLFTEHLLIAFCGVCVGVALARPVVEALVLSEAAHLPRPEAIRFDAPVWWVAVAVAIVLAIVLTIQPLQLRASLLRTTGRTTGRVVRRSRTLMVATEIALALTLATGGSMLALSLARLLATDPGFVASGAAAARVSAYAAKYPTQEQVVRFFDEVIARLKEVPQVTAAGAGLSLPLSGQSTGSSVVAEGRPVLPASRPTAGWQFVTPEYFRAAGMTIRLGRDFSAADRDRRSHVTIINEDLARALFPGEDPVGKRIGVGGGDSTGDWHEIVGVVADVRHQSLDTASSPRVYDLFGQHWGRSMFVVARTATSESAPLLGAVRRTVAGLDPEAPVFEAATLETLVDRSAAARRLASTVAIALAGAGMLLALIGVYAVSAASVAERSREIGVRAALGATPRDLFALIAGEGAWTAIAGGAAGIAGSLLIVRLLDAHLFGVRPSDAGWLIPLVAVLVFAAAVCAAVPPARRAASIDPMTVIRTD